MPRSWFLLLLVCAATGLHAQTFNLQTGREPVASLNGLWRFHTGDNPARDLINAILGKRLPKSS